MDHALHPTPWRFNPLAWLTRRPAATARSAVDPLQHLRTLAGGQMLRVDAPLGHEIVCVQGSLWITHDGDPKDIIVDAGQRYVADRHAPLVVYALDKARFLLHPADAETA
jgi:hypothetical protein